MEILFILLFDEIVMGIGYLLLGIIAVGAINYILSNFVKILFVIGASVLCIKFIRRTGKAGFAAIASTAFITIANFALTDYLYGVSPEYKYNTNTGIPVTIVRCSSEFTWRDCKVSEGDIIVLETLTDSEKWNTSVEIYGEYSSSFYAAESISTVMSVYPVRKLIQTTRPVADKLEDEYKTLKYVSDEKVIEEIKTADQDLQHMQSSSADEQIIKYREQIVNNTFSDVKDGTVLRPGDVKERTLLQFDEDTVHIIRGTYKCVPNSNYVGFHWDEVAIISESTTTYTIEKGLFGSVTIRTPSRSYQVHTDDSFTVQSIDVYD